MAAVRETVCSFGSCPLLVQLWGGQAPPLGSVIADQKCLLHVLTLIAWRVRLFLHLAWKRCPGMAPF